VVAIIARLALTPNLRVTLLSGRRLQDIQRLIPVSGIFSAGTYGIELETPSGELVQRVAYNDVRPQLERIKPQWESLLQGREGFFLEDKGWALALHARFAPALEASQVIEQADAVAGQESPSDHLKIFRGYKFLEIAPKFASKKETVDYLLCRYPFSGARLLYIGDDEQDEEAFSAIHAHGGAAVRIIRPLQPIASMADFKFASPASLLRWLEKLSEPSTNEMTRIHE